MIDGLTLVMVLVLVLLGLSMFAEPPRYRCGTCGATFAHFPHLTDHEAQHRPRLSCSCGTGGVHHPSCPTRGNVAKRVAA